MMRVSGWSRFVPSETALFHAANDLPTLKVVQTENSWPGAPALGGDRFSRRGFINIIGQSHCQGDHSALCFCSERPVEKNALGNLGR
jgi:hypothetical protein